MKRNHAISEGMNSLFANRIRSSLSVLGIVFGVAAVVAMLAVIEGARSDVLERLSRLGTNVLFVFPAKGDSSFTRTMQYGDAIRLENSTKMIHDVAPALLCSNQQSRNVIGVTSSYMPIRQLALQGGRAITDLDLKNRLRVCVVGRDVIGDDGKSVGMGDVLHVENQMYQVVGVIASVQSTRDRSLSSLMRNHNKAILIPLTVVSKSDGVIQDAIPLSEITVRSHHSEYLLPLSRIVHRVLQSGKLNELSVDVVVPRQLLREEQHTQLVFAAVVGCVAFIGVLVGGIGVMNIMLANVAQRYREIGIRRAIGATRAQISSLFLIESALLTIFGGIGGILLGIAASLLIAQFGGWPVHISIWSILLAMGMAFCVGIGAGWYPASLAANLDPVDAMR